MEPNLGFLLAAVSCLVGGGVGWGTVRATLNASVKSIKESADKLSVMATDVATVQAVQAAHAESVRNQDERIRELELKVAALEARTQLH